MHFSEWILFIFFNFVAGEMVLVFPNPPSLPFLFSLNRLQERVLNERDDALRSKTNYKNQLRAAKQEIDRLTYLHRQVLVMEASRPHSNGDVFLSDVFFFNFVSSSSVFLFHLLPRICLLQCMQTNLSKTEMDWVSFYSFDVSIVCPQEKVGFQVEKLALLLRLFQRTRILTTDHLLFRIW